MIELIERQRRELKEIGGGEICFSDPDTKQEYVLVRREVYEELGRLINFDALATGELVDRIIAEDDANDPSLESYQSITRAGKS